MKMFNRIALATALMVSAVAAPASAQSWKWDLGVQAGYARFTSSVNNDSLGIPNAAGDADNPYLRFENKVRFGGTLGYWFTQNFGIRANYKYSDNSLMEGVTETKLIEPVNLHSGSGDLLFRLGHVNDTWMGSEFLPYLALGLGAKWANPTQDAQTCVDLTPGENKTWNCYTATAPQGGRLVALSEDKTIMGLVGLGADWRFSPHVALSLEANDRIFRPQIAFATATGTAGTFNMPNGDHRISKWTHELGADIGLKFLFGLATPPVVVAPPPPPAPREVVVTPPPPPPPAPVENAIQVCVVDPSQPNGLRMQNAIFLPASGDTMVMMNGNRVRLNTTVGNVMVARNADWYVRGEPLKIVVNKDLTMSYSTEGGARMVNAGDLAYLGTANGYPVYANASEVADVSRALGELRRANASRDLGNILDERKDLRGELDDVKLVYVPLQPTGCVLQPFRMMEPVKKGK
jgi:opacity protein-like surface antigen